MDHCAFFKSEPESLIILYRFLSFPFKEKTKARDLLCFLFLEADSKANHFISCVVVFILN